MEVLEKSIKPRKNEFDLKKRKINLNYTKRKSQTKYDDAPFAAVLDRDNLTIRFFEEMSLDKALLRLEKENTFFAEQGR